MSASRPALWILCPVEARPRVVLDCLDDGEERRVLDWLRSRPELSALVVAAAEAGARGVELVEEDE